MIAEETVLETAADHVEETEEATELSDVLKCSAPPVQPVEIPAKCLSNLRKTGPSTAKLALPNEKAVRPMACLS